MTNNMMYGLILSLSLVACGGSGDSSNGVGVEQQFDIVSRGTESTIVLSAVELLKTHLPQEYELYLGYKDVIYIVNDLRWKDRGVDGLAYRGKIYLNERSINTRHPRYAASIIMHEIYHLRTKGGGDEAEADALEAEIIRKLGGSQAEINYALDY